MDGLELKHLAPYLPYELRCEILNYKSDYVGIKYATIKGYYMIDETPHYNFSLGRSNAGKHVDLFKPILRPLSDLTKEIEVDGEKFIPIKVLYDMLRPFESYKSHHFGRVLEFYTYDKNGSALEWFEIFNEGSLSFHVVAKGKKVLLNNQLNAFNKLSEWHFDTKGLIEKGLAIDINTLK